MTDQRIPVAQIESGVLLVDVETIAKLKAELASIAKACRQVVKVKAFAVGRTVRCAANASALSLRASSGGEARAWLRRRA